MEASVVAPPVAPADPEPSHDGEAEATRSTEELFQWSAYVSVGAGAVECEHATDGACADKKHFHAWTCLPNPYQVRDIVDKARAARARKARALKDAGDPTHADPKRREPSDSYVTLESELDSFRMEQAYKELCSAIGRRNIERQLVDILDDLQKDDRFEHHPQDAEEFRRMEAIPEDERDAEEYERLQRDMLDYGEAMQKEIDERIKAEIAHLEAKPQDEVIEVERQFRIEDIAAEVYLHSYYTWVIYTCTCEPVAEGYPSQRKFKDPAELKNAPTEVVVALRETIRQLEQRTQRGDAAGNS